MSAARKKPTDYADSEQYSWDYPTKEQIADRFLRYKEYVDYSLARSLSLEGSEAEHLRESAIWRAGQLAEKVFGFTENCEWSPFQNIYEHAKYLCDPARRVTLLPLAELGLDYDAWHSTRENCYGRLNRLVHPSSAQWGLLGMPTWRKTSTVENSGYRDSQPLTYALLLINVCAYVFSKAINADEVVARQFQPQSDQWP
jgi:hypothetical protein